MRLLQKAEVKFDGQRHLSGFYSNAKKAYYRQILTLETNY